ncbi:MAG TPA: MFS transporter [Ktedonobacteraceae bacterium]
MNTFSTRFARAPLGLAFFGFILIGLSGGANGVIIPSLSAFYHVVDAVICFLFLLSSLGYFLSALGSGLLTERLGLRWLLGLGAGILLLGMLGFAAQLPFALLLIARLCLGFGVGIIETGFNIHVSAQPRHTVLLNYLHAFYGAGALVGPLLVTGILALLWGWNITYVLLAALSLPLLIGILLLMSAPTLEKAVNKEESPAKGNLLGATLALPIVWIAGIFLLVYVGVESSIGNWAYSFLLEDRAQGTLSAGWIASGYWIGLTLGRFLIQRQAERMGIGVAALMYACIVGIVIGSLLIWLVPFGVAAAFGFCFLGFSLAPIYPLTVAILPRLVPERLAASAIGLLVSVSIIGIALFPWAAGILAQIIGIWTLLPYILALALVMLGFWVYLSRPVGASEVRETHEEQMVS